VADEANSELLNTEEVSKPNRIRPFPHLRTSNPLNLSLTKLLVHQFYHRSNCLLWIQGGRELEGSWEVDFGSVICIWHIPLIRCNECTPHTLQQPHPRSREWS